VRRLVSKNSPGARDALHSRGLTRHMAGRHCATVQAWCAPATPRALGGRRREGRCSMTWTIARPVASPTSPCSRCCSMRARGCRTCWTCECGMCASIRRSRFVSTAKMPIAHRAVCEARRKGQSVDRGGLCPSGPIKRNPFPQLAYCIAANNCCGPLLFISRNWSVACCACWAPFCAISKLPDC